MTEMMINRVGRAIRAELQADRYFVRRAPDESCYELLKIPQCAASQEHAVVLQSFDTEPLAERARSKLAQNSIARAAIEAMREPTKSMAEMQETAPDGNYRQIWMALIDEALK